MLQSFSERSKMTKRLTIATLALTAAVGLCACRRGSDQAGGPQASATNAPAQAPAIVQPGAPGQSSTVVASVPSRVRVAEHGSELLRGNAEVTLLVATILAYRLDVLNGYLADIKAQYSDTAGHLGLIHEVLADLATSKPHAMELGSEREPDPLY